MNTSYINIEAIKQAYAPYNRFPKFEQGYADAMAGNGFREYADVEGQAYDRGYEAGRKVQSAARWVEENVGAN